MRLRAMERNDPVRQEWKRRTLVAEVGSRQNVRELARFLGLEANTVAEGLVEAAERDQALKQHARACHAA
jgi:hypothetical protein